MVQEFKRSALAEPKGFARTARKRLLPEAPEKLGLIIGVLSLLLLALAIATLAGYPLSGKFWISYLALGSLATTVLTLTVSSRTTTKVTIDLRQLNPLEQLTSVREVMNVRLATVENGIHKYRGYLRTDSETAFAHLARALEVNGAIVKLETDEVMEVSVTVIPRSCCPIQPKPGVNWIVHLMLFCVTAVTATLAGAIHQGINPLTTGAEQWLKGLPYALALLSILAVHEAGHYAVAKYYKVNVTPPFFIPAPLPLGTFGAVTSMRSPSRNRRIMFDTAAAGPLLGLMASLVFLAVGLESTDIGASVFKSELLSPKPGASAMFTLIAAMANPSLTYGSSLDLHPFAFAGWLGLLITAINLIPIGQLDGGRIGHALLGPKKGDRLSRIAMILLMISACLVWSSLLIFALLVFFLAGRTERALDDVSPLGPERTVIGVFSFLCLLAILLPVPAPVFHLLFD